MKRQKKSPDHLVNLAAESVAKSYLEQHPDSLGKMLSEMTIETRTAAIESIKPWDVTRAKDELESLKACDTITIYAAPMASDFTTADDAVFNTVDLSFLPDTFATVLAIWYELWLKEPVRRRETESDGSARLYLNYKASELDVAIEKFVKEQNELNQCPSDGEEDEGDVDTVDELDADTVCEEIVQFLRGEAWDRTTAARGEKKRRFVKSPKITVRFDTEPIGYDRWE